MRNIEETSTSCRSGAKPPQAAFDALYDWFDEASADRAAKTAEAYHAGKRGRILGQQINMLIEEAAKAAATPFAEVELYKGIAARATCDARMLNHD